MRKQTLTTGETFNNVVKEYAPNDSVLRRDDERTHACKKAVFEALTEAERNTLISYAELQSYTQVARLLGVGRTTIRDELARIRTKIKDYIKANGYDDKTLF